jgi:ParB family chromosome partitioning protein
MLIQAQKIPTIDQAYNKILFGSQYQVKDIEISELEFNDQQVFRMYYEDEQEIMVKSIQENGIIHPIIARPFNEKYQILSGRNRTACAKIAGLTKIPCMVIDCDDVKAKLIINDSNLCVRKDLSLRELAFGFREQLEGYIQLGNGRKTISLVAEQTGENVKTVQRYIRLTYLIDSIFSLIEQKKMPLMAGVNLSYLTNNEQEIVYNCLIKNKKVKLNENLAKKINELPVKNEFAINELLKGKNINDKKSNKFPILSKNEVRLKLSIFKIIKENLDENTANEIIKQIEDLIN